MNEIYYRLIFFGKTLSSSTSLLSPLSSSSVLSEIQNIIVTRDIKEGFQMKKHDLSTAS
jgi:hypothetical protein